MRNSSRFVSTPLDMTSGRPRLLKSAKPRIGKIVSRAIGRPTRWIHFAVWPHRNRAPVGLTATFSQIADEFFACVKLRARRLVTIEIAHQTNAERNVVQIITVHVPAVDLAAPAIAHFNLAVSRGCSVPNHEMIGKTILHPAHVPMIIIEDTRVALPRAAIMHHNELPATPFHRRASDRFDHRSRQITIVTRTARPGPETSSRRRRWRRLETLVFFQTRFFDHNLSTLAA